MVNPADPSISKGFISENFVKQREALERQQNEKEVLDMFQNYSRMLEIDPNSTDNRFVTTFYNKYPKQLVKSDPRAI